MTTVADLLRQARALLLDFDGPVAALMPPPANAHAADNARTALDGINLPPDIASSTDHLAVLRYAAEHHPHRLESVERACTEAEIDAARQCEPGPYALDLLNYAARAGTPVALVSNNADPAVRAFFATQKWTGRVTAFSCRTPETATRLKPDPFLLFAAGRELGVDLAESVFVGDSVSDVQAGAVAHVPVIGIAKHEQRATDLYAAGARVVVRSGDGAALLG